MNEFNLIPAIQRAFNICMEKVHMNDFSGFYRRVPGIHQQRGRTPNWAKFTYKKPLIKACLLLIFLQSLSEPWATPSLKSNALQAEAESEVRMQGSVPVLGARHPKSTLWYILVGWIYKRLTALLSLSIETLDYKARELKKESVYQNPFSDK